jgi:hypothetical protein
MKANDRIARIIRIGRLPHAYRHISELSRPKYKQWFRRWFAITGRAA